MAILNFLKKKPEEYFSPSEKDFILSAIKQAEQQTSGEVRVFIESTCRFVDPVDRAAEIFAKLKMDQTEQRNACLVYIAMKDKQLAVFGDEGIHQKVGTPFWTTEVAKMLGQFNGEHYAEGITTVVQDIGEALHLHFPYNASTDKNELPDEIVFGN